MRPLSPINYVFILIILGLGWVGYYEYDQLQKQNTRDKAEFESTIGPQMVHLQEENTKLATDNAELAKKLAEAQAKITSLTNAAPAPSPTNGQPAPAGP